MKLINLFTFLYEKRNKIRPQEWMILNYPLLMQEDEKDVMGDMHIEFYDSSIRLPDNLTIIGNLSLRGSDISRLPKNLNITGGLNISKSKISRLPSSLVVGTIIKMVNMNGGGDTVVIPKSSRNTYYIVDNALLSDYRDIYHDYTFSGDNYSY